MRDVRNINSWFITPLWQHREITSIDITLAALMLSARRCYHQPYIGLTGHTAPYRVTAFGCYVVIVIHVGTAVVMSECYSYDAYCYRRLLLLLMPNTTANTLFTIARFADVSIVGDMTLAAEMVTRTLPKCLVTRHATAHTPH